MAGKEYTTSSESLGISDLGGGLNSTSNPLALSDNEMSDLLNVDFDIFGSIKKRNGYTELNDTAANSGAACTGLYDFSPTISGAASMSNFFVGSFGDKLFKMDGLDGTWDEISLSGASITDDANLLMDFSALDDLLVMTNNEDQPIKWTGSGSASPADVPLNLTKAKCVETWNNYMFYGNTVVDSTLYSSRIYWSDLKDPTTWQATKFIDIDKGDGDKIVGIKALGDRLCIFKEESIHNVLFTGDSDIPFIVIKSQSDTGAISGYSIQKIDNNLMFLSSDGFYIYDGNNSIKISDRITTTLNTFAKNRYQYATSGYYGNKNLYWCSFTTSGGTENNRIVTYNSAKNAFSIYDGIAANAIITFKSSGAERIYFGDYDGYCYRADTGLNDNPLKVETAINGYYKTKWFSFGNLMEKKGIGHIVIYYNLSQSTVNSSYSYDLEGSPRASKNFFIGTSGDTYGSSLYGEAVYAKSGGDITRQDLTGRGRLVRFELSNNTIDETFQINGYGFYPHMETVS